MNMNYKLMATTVFGLEAIAAYEIKSLGFENVIVENGRVFFEGTEAGIVKANLWLRCVERVFICVGSFKATSFEALFDGVNALPWELYIPENATFPVNAKSVKSKLFSLSDIQKISKKAIVKRLSRLYGVSWFEETGETYALTIALLNDNVTVMIDTSGEGLHKRGYRERGNEAPMKETLAAGLLQVARWQPKIPLIDPMCGSGTIVIEAAMIAKNIAPGLNRNFASEAWPKIGKELWKAERMKAYSAIRQEVDVSLYGYDIDSKSIAIARENAELAGVDDIVSFSVRAVQSFETDTRYGYILCNPPYGERLSEKKAVEKLYTDMGKVFKQFPTWSKYIITSYENFETAYGMKANKNRKLYNGRIKTYFYQFYGEKPPKSGRSKSV
ncbi:MAG: putative N6-adenine-specific methylase [Clostridiales bacterium]|nr:putative N6-adenine-specific methylase [Clostridiales bacterium]MDN5300340.1 putative N6-adenine-specific methylase [Clostridiales bacterium]